MSSGSTANFIETKQYLRFKEFCDACSKYRYIGLCYGMPGVGKTLSARYYANWDLVERFRKNMPSCGIAVEDVKGSDVVFYTPPVVASYTGRLPNEIKELRHKLRDFLLEEIRKEELPKLQDAQRLVDALYDRSLGYNGYTEPPEEVFRRHDAWHRAHDVMTDRMLSQPDPTTLILVDEADRLKVTGLEQMRDIFDRGGIGMIFIGMPGLEKKLARYPQLYSRVGFVHEFQPLSQAEVRQLFRDGWAPPGISLPVGGLADEEALATLIRVADGKFRLLNRLLTQISRISEINGVQNVTREVVEAARESLVIGTA